MFGKHHLFAAAAIASMALAGTAAHAADIFTLSSTTFQDGKIMPKKVANNRAGNANCVGENVPPQFSWTNVPAGTKSFPDAIVAVLDSAVGWLMAAGYLATAQFVWLFARLGAIIVCKGNWR